MRNPRESALENSEDNQDRLNDRNENIKQYEIINLNARGKEDKTLDRNPTHNVHSNSDSSHIHKNKNAISRKCNATGTNRVHGRWKTHEQGRHMPRIHDLLHKLLYLNRMTMFIKT